MSLWDILIFGITICHVTILVEEEVTLSIDTGYGCITWYRHNLMGNYIQSKQKGVFLIRGWTKSLKDELGNSLH